MSQIYIQEPPTSGRVVLHTTIGDIDIELWCREVPKACRNFIQLCLEGYYEDVIFHRVVKNFIVQGGDPTGTGMGGESIYGEPFADEYHTRLRFTRRGLVGMATATVNDNTSQFFITLAPTPELQNKHTLFGRVAGDTVFNALQMNELKLNEERPVQPPKIISAEVLEKFFNDIVPRTTAAEKRNARIAEEKRRAALEADKKRPKKGVKNKTLLSFADDEDDISEVTKSSRDRVKIRSSHDVLENDPRLSRKVAVELSEANTTIPAMKATIKSTEGSKPASIFVSDTTKPEEQFDKEMREKILAEKAAQAAKNAPKKVTVHDEIARVKENIRAMEAKRKSDNDTTLELAQSKSIKESWLQQSLAEYKGSGKSLFGGRKRRKAADESKTLAMLDAFTSKLTTLPMQTVEKDKSLTSSLKEASTTTIATTTTKTTTKDACQLHQVINCESCTRHSMQMETDNSSDAVEILKEFAGETWNEQGWLSHELVFEKDTKGKDLMKKRDNIDDYVVIDPRVREAQSKRLDKDDRPRSRYSRNNDDRRRGKDASDYGRSRDRR